MDKALGHGESIERLLAGGRKQEMTTKTFVDFVKNPTVYTLFDRFTRQAMSAGLTKCSSRMIVERIRWETAIKTNAVEQIDGRDIKIGNNHTAYLSRWWKERNPRYRSMFATRRVACDTEGESDDE